MGDYFKKTAFSFKYGYYAAEWLLIMNEIPRRRAVGSLESL